MEVFVKEGAEVRVGGDARLGSVTGEWVNKTTIKPQKHTKTLSLN